MDDVFVRLGVAGRVVDIPAEGFEQGIDELAANLGFIVVAASVCIGVIGETFGQAEHLWGAWHGLNTTESVSERKALK